MSKGDLVRFVGLTVVALSILTLPLVGQDTSLSDTQTTGWPQWRGPLATGVSPTADPPTEWSETKNVRWKVELPGHGSASPIVWDDHIFILSAIPAGVGSEGGPGLFGRLRDRLMGTVSSSEVQQFIVTAYDRHDGSVVWERIAVSEPPHQRRHATGSWASASAVTDGEVLCAFFGSRGLYCYDLEGTLLWDQDFGDMEVRMGFGEGASPALHGDSIVVVWDHQGQSFITSLDKWTGQERWRTPREEITSWSTPTCCGLPRENSGHNKCDGSC